MSDAGCSYVWARIIENLAMVGKCASRGERHALGSLTLCSFTGYDPNSMFLMGYDWRLAYIDLEKRDRLLTKLKRVRLARSQELLSVCIHLLSADD